MRAKVDIERIMNSLIVEAVLTKAQSRGLDAKLIESAYEFAKDAVGDRLRKDGTSLIGHFISVAAILALELEVTDSEIIAAGLLHSLVSHSDITFQMVEDKFGKRISELMKLWKVSPEDEKKQRVVIKRLQESPESLAALVKLSDRLDNLRRLVFADRPGTRDHYIQQTENIYLPFAKRTNEYIYKGFLRTLEKVKAQQHD